MIGKTNSNLSKANITVNQFFIKVIDYNGETIDEQYTYEGNIFTLPNTPTHTGLTFDKWICNEDISNNTVGVSNNIVIGATYNTTSLQNEFDIVLSANDNLTVTLNMNGTKDWGDGTSDTSTSHTYVNYGKYTIKCSGAVMDTGSSSGLFNQNSSKNNNFIISIRLSNVTSITQYAFQYCKNLQSISIPNTVTSIGQYAFDNCSNLTAITLSENILTIGQYAFRNCKNLESIAMFKNITSLDNNTFDGCSSLQFIVLPKNLTNISNYLFNNCENLQSLVIPENVLTIGHHAFLYCKKLNYIKLPETLTNIEQYAFDSCYNLQHITIPKNVVSIKQYAFGHCYNLNSIILSPNLYEMDDRVFYNSKNVRILDMPNTLNTINKYDDSSTNSDITVYNFSKNITVPTLAQSLSIFPSGKIYVPRNLYDEWIETENWVNYKDNIYGGDPATINFNITPASANLYIDGELITNNTIQYKKYNLKYTIYDSTNNKVLVKTRSNIQSNEIINITEDLTSETYNKFIIYTGVSGLDIVVYINGIEFVPLEESTGYYVINVHADTDVLESIYYKIYCDSSYLDAEGYIQNIGLDVRENVALVPATQIRFSRPDLTENGILGGNAFAVDAPGSEYRSSAYEAVDDSDTTYWQSSNGASYIIYNPNPINITRFILTFSSTSYIANNAVVYGSSNNITYDLLDSSYSGFNSGYYLYIYNNSRFYKYYKIIFTVSWTFNLCDLYMEATYKRSN